MNNDVEPLKIIESSIKNKNFDEALKLCKKHSKLIPKRDYFYLTSVCYRYLNKLDDALKGLDQLIQIDPKYGRAFQEFGHVHVLLKDKDKALKAYLRAVRHNPSLQASWLGILSIEENNNDLIEFVAKKAA